MASRHMGVGEGARSNLILLSEMQQDSAEHRVRSVILSGFAIVIGRAHRWRLSRTYTQPVAVTESEHAMPRSEEAIWLAANPTSPLPRVQASFEPAQKPLCLAKHCAPLQRPAVQRSTFFVHWSAVPALNPDGQPTVASAESCVRRSPSVVSITPGVAASSTIYNSNPIGCIPSAVARVCVRCWGQDATSAAFVGALLSWLARFQ